MNLLSNKARKIIDIAMLLIVVVTSIFLIWLGCNY